METIVPKLFRKKGCIIMENKNMEGFETINQVCEGGKKSKTGLIVAGGIAVGAALAFGAKKLVGFLKNRKKDVVEAEYVVIDDEANNEE